MDGCLNAAEVFSLSVKNVRSNSLCKIEKKKKKPVIFPFILQTVWPIIKQHFVHRTKCVMRVEAKKKKSAEAEMSSRELSAN